MKRILIMGPGCSGTTFMWSLMKGLGYQTEPVGIEANRQTPEVLRYSDTFKGIKDGTIEAPKVIKHLGGFCYNLNEHIDTFNWNVEHIFFCLRRLENSIERRNKKGLSAKMLDVDKKEFSASTEEHKQDILTQELFKMVGAGIFNLIQRDHPFTIIRFPKSIIDANYCWGKTYPVHHLDFNKFNVVWEKTRRVNWGGEIGVQPRHYEEEGVTPEKEILDFWDQTEKGLLNK